MSQCILLSFFSSFYITHLCILLISTVTTFFSPPSFSFCQCRHLFLSLCFPPLSLSFCQSIIYLPVSSSTLTPPAISLFLLAANWLTFISSFLLFFHIISSFNFQRNLDERQQDKIRWNWHFLLMRFTACRKTWWVSLTDAQAHTAMTMDVSYTPNICIYTHLQFKGLHF